MSETYSEDQVFIGEYPPDAAEWCAAAGFVIKEIAKCGGQRRFQIAKLPMQTAEQKLAEAKIERAETVARIKVTVDGFVFDGDEQSQSRMSRTISSAVAQGADLSTTMRTWVLADNSIAEVSVLQLARALELAGNAQTEAWVKPYETASETKEAVE